MVKQQLVIESQPGWDLCRWHYLVFNRNAVFDYLTEGVLDA